MATSSQADFAFRFVGLVELADPLRPSVPEAVHQCQTAGIWGVMITGDYGLPIFFSPIHIAFFEMVIDPVCSLAFEAEIEERDLMRRPLRRPDAPLFSWSLMGWSVLQGVFAFLAVAGTYVAALYRGMPENEARAIGFVSLILTIFSLVLVNHSFSTSLVSAFRRPNGALASILLVIVTALAAILLWPAAASLFRFGPLHADDLLTTIAAAAAVLLGLELVKPIWRAQLRT
ncbi:MAG: cation-translocating P-type ATPase [Bradyrhizobium sp.]|nr:cation-translocating P-type ATPase [Pseudomonadota bacterium]MDE2469623.1 cation-translocating P-type ATPase [Bradyrhizobium sp.]